MTSYTMSRTFVTSKVKRSPKLRGVRRARTFVYQSNRVDILGFCIRTFFTEKKKKGTYNNHELTVRLIPTSVWYDLLTVSQFWPSNHQQLTF